MVFSGRGGGWGARGSAARALALGAACGATLLALWGRPATAQDFADEVGQNLAFGVPTGAGSVPAADGDEHFAPKEPERLLDDGLEEPFAMGRDEIPKLLRSAYNRLTYHLQEDDEDHDGFIRPPQLKQLVRLALNPGNAPMTKKEEETLERGIQELMRKEGLLHHPDRQVHLQYISRGNPLAKITELNNNLAAVRRKEFAKLDAAERASLGKAQDTPLDVSGDADEFDLPKTGRRSRRLHPNTPSDEL